MFPTLGRLAKSATASLQLSPCMRKVRTHISQDISTNFATSASFLFRLIRVNVYEDKILRSTSPHELISDLLDKSLTVHEALVGDHTISVCLIPA